MTVRRFPPPWSVEDWTVLTRHIRPDQQDFEAVEKEYGPLPPTASRAALTERYRLAQAAKVARLLEQVAIGGKTKNRKSKHETQR